VWRVDLRQPTPLVERAAQLLTERERAHAERGVADVKRRRTLLRAALRITLARWLGRAPETLLIVSDFAGKPQLEDGAAHFSVTSSRDCGLIALTDLGALGVDVECVRPLDDLDAISARSFSADAAREVSVERGELKLAAFFRHWTRLEARLKASGIGLAADLDRRASEREGGAWTFTAVDAGPGFAGAVAVEGAYDWSDCTLQARELDLASELAC
jgi:4'-phosphopantetheinyl transferase